MKNKTRKFYTVRPFMPDDNVTVEEILQRLEAIGARKKAVIVSAYKNKCYTQQPSRLMFTPAATIKHHAKRWFVVVEKRKGSHWWPAEQTLISYKGCATYYIGHE
jgi:hypothetical protein